MEVGKVCQIKHPVAMPRWKAEGEGRSKRTGQAGAGEVPLAKTDAVGALTGVAKILYVYAL